MAFTVQHQIETASEILRMKKSMYYGCGLVFSHLACD